MRSQLHKWDIPADNPFEGDWFWTGRSRSASLRRLAFSQAVVKFYQLVRASNKFIDEQAPFI